MNEEIKFDSEIISCGELSGVVVTQHVLSGTVSILKDRSTYSGPYRVTPSGNEQKLYTSEKVMAEDVTVESIPYFEVSNTSGGTTAIIGGNN